MISLALDAAYALLAAITAPWWMRKARGGWSERFGATQPLQDSLRPRLLLHAVSVGEVSLTPPLVEALAPHVDVVLSVTTDTGIARAKELYSSLAAPRCSIVRYPLDASWSVRRFLDAVRPSAVALVELELWPNFALACAARGIPLAVVNGRLSERSFRNYRRARFFMGRYFRMLDFAAVQDDAYASRFRSMGVEPERCHVVGTMKWDAAISAPDPDVVDGLARSMGIDRARPLIVAGSTAPEEHALLHRATPPGVQLLCAPRRPEWFEDASRDLPGCVRRSAMGSARAGADRFLLDSIGELAAAYALADIAVIGRSFGSLHGSNPMEPAAFGKPVLIGPAHADFRASVEALESEGGLLKVNAESLPGVLKDLCEDHERRARMSASAARCVARHRGATKRNADLVLRMMGVERA